MDKKMYEAATKTLDKAYVKYSNFRVGAALKLKDGRIITGVNIENASYGLSNCAERTALFTAYAEGYTRDDIDSILITTEQDHLVSPCGACRQVMNELMPAEADVYMTTKKGDVKHVLNKDLLPFGFSGDDL